MQVQPLGWEEPLEKEGLPTPVFWPREPHGQRSPAGYSPWGRRGSDTTEQPTLLHLAQSLQGPSVAVWVTVSFLVLVRSYFAVGTQWASQVAQW